MKLKARYAGSATPVPAAPKPKGRLDAGLWHAVGKSLWSLLSHLALFEQWDAQASLIFKSLIWIPIKGNLSERLSNCAELSASCLSV